MYGPTVYVLLSSQEALRRDHLAAAGHEKAKHLLELKDPNQPW
jgi:hypothetical protein